VIDEWGFDAPSTKNARQALSVLGLEGRVLVVIEPDDHNAGKSFRNLPEVHLLEPGELNAYDVLCSDWVVFTRAALPTTAAAPAAAIGATAAPVSKAEAETAVAPPESAASAPDETEAAE
jgi:large subunit ribosomal protein L4